MCFFAFFIVEFITQDVNVNKIISVKWRKMCRVLCRREEVHSDHLLFSSFNVMTVFTQHAITLSELTAQMSLIKENKTIKKWKTRLHRFVSIIRLTEIRHVQQCVRWVLKHEIGLIVVGGDHSDHCLWSNVVSIDMNVFDQINIHTTKKNEKDFDFDFDFLIVAEIDCKTKNIVRKIMKTDVTVFLKTRPSVDARLWLQNDIEHFARLHELACDVIVGVVVVSFDFSKVLCVDRVSSQHRPAAVIRSENESSLLWIMKGAGINFDIVVSVIFKVYAAPTYLTRNWAVPLSDNFETRLRLSDFDELVVRKFFRNCSADAYLYWDVGQLHLDVIMFEFFTIRLTFATPTPIGAIWGPEDKFKTVDGVGLFETEMYVSEMHSGHGGGQTSSFKQCLFLRRIGETNVADRLVTAVKTPSPLCYLHLLQGGEAVGDVAVDVTAFDCRDWGSVCVIIDVWFRNQDSAEAARSVVRWIYNVVGNLLFLNNGAYSADLEPNFRDVVLTIKIFESNRLRLIRFKHSSDPRNVLIYAYPFSKTSMKQKFIIFITGENCAEKNIVSTFEFPCSSNAFTKASRHVQSALAMRSNKNMRRLSVPTWAVCFEIVPTRSSIGQRWRHFFKNRRGNDLDF